MSSINQISINEIISNLFKELKTKDAKYSDAFIHFFINVKNYVQYNEVFTNLFFFILLIFMIIVGYILFFLNPYNILNYIRYPLIVLYMLITGFILFFMLLKTKKEYSKIYNLKLELSLYSINFGKLVLFVVGIFLAFYIVYGLFISLMTKSLKFSFVFTLIIVLLLLSIINSYTNMYNVEISDNSFLNFIKDLIFYIPCLITDFVDFMIKDYNQTPSTVIILLIMLIIICIIYFLYNNNNNVPKNTIILVDKPVYLNTSVIFLTQDELNAKIIENKPFYERELIKIQKIRQFDSSLNDISFNDTDTGLINIISKIPSYADKYTRKFYNTLYNGQIEGFQNIITQETIPVHLTLTDYDQYILKQALWKNPELLKNDTTDTNKDLGETINNIIKAQTTIMGYYEWFLLKLQTLNSSNISKYILGDMTTVSYHYGLSYWLYLNKQSSVTNKQTNPDLNNKDLILSYGNRPSMYYDHNTKELIVEYISTNSNKNIILYKSTDILYQRWNHIVMNYDYGIFDLFINGHLVYSNPDIVDFITKYEVLQVGNTNNSNIGGISYMYYYEEPIDLEQIQKIYTNHPSF
jgi:hypothetical protein